MTLKVMEWPSSSRRLSGLRFVHISLIKDLKQSIAISNQQTQNNDLFSSVYMMIQLQGPQLSQKTVTIRKTVKH